MKKSTYMIVTLVSFVVVIAGYMWLESATYALELPINKPENLTYIRIDNYEDHTAKFITGEDDIIAVADILNNCTDATEKADNQDDNVQYVVFVTDGSKSLTFNFYDNYIGSEGHWFKNDYEATQKIKEIFGKLNYETKELAE